MPAGYSGTPLIKLGLKAESRAILINAPPHYGELMGDLPDGLQFEKRAAGTFDFIQLFSATRADLTRRLPSLKKKLAYNGTMWVSWPKQTSPLHRSSRPRA